MSLVAHYKMNDNLADTVVNESINDYHGVASHNTEDMSVDGKISRALDFDAENDYIEITRNSNLDVYGKTVLSGFAWVNCRSNGSGGNSYGRVFDKMKEDSSGGATSGYRLRVRDPSGGYIKFGAYVVTTGTRAYAWTNVALLGFNSFHHIGFTWNEDGDGALKMYLDGVKRALHGSSTPSSTNTPTDDSGHNLFISRTNDPGSAYEPFDGRIDDVRIYSHALTQAEITALYNNGSGIANSYVYYIPPSYVYEETVRHRTNIILMEDGGEVRNSYGVARRVFTLNYDRITVTDKDAIQDFFDARVGRRDSFGWVNPNDNVEYTVRFIPEALEIKEVSYQVYNIQVSFIEVV